jgi:hypothetical protein
MYTGLDSFRRRYDLSIRALSHLFDSSSGISKSSVERLCRGTANPAYVEKMRPFITQRLKTFLIEKGKSEAEVAAELSTIFPVVEDSKEQPTEIFTIIVPAQASSTYVFKSPQGRTVGAFEFADNQS